jgi:hypothetical protein
MSFAIDVVIAALAYHEMRRVFVAFDRDSE